MTGSGLVEGMGGLTLAGSFALLGPWRVSRIALLCAVQAAVVGIAAAAQGAAGAAAVEVAEAGLLVWSANAGCFRVLSRRTDVTGTHQSAAWILCAAGLAVLASGIGANGIALAVVMLSLLMLVQHEPARQALGLVALHTGLVLAGITSDLTGWGLAPVVLPLLPAAGVLGLWLGGNRRWIARLRGTALTGRVEVVLCLLALLAACLLPWWLGRYPPIWLLDARAAHVTLLLCALAAAAGWSARDAGAVCGSRLAVLAGSVVAVLTDAPLASWWGIAIAALAAACTALPNRAAAWRRLMLASSGLGLALFGTISLQSGAPLVAGGLVALGYLMLALLAPELAITAAALVVRLPGPGIGPLLLAAGLAALLLAALVLACRRSVRDSLPWIDLAQAGVAGFAFGLGTPAGNLAGLLQLTLLTLTRCALLLARPDGLDRIAALAGLAGVPPFGVFASLAMILAATTAQMPWLVLPLGAGLATIAWFVLRDLPAGRALAPSLAWLPLVLALLCSFAMPAPLLAWFRLAAR